MGQRSVDGALRSHARAAISVPRSVCGRCWRTSRLIPDFALDMHTMKGKAMGRGSIFWKEGAEARAGADRRSLRGRSLQALGDQAAGQVNPASGRISLIFVCAVFVCAETFGVCRHLSSILLNNFVAGGTSHQARTGLRRRKHFSLTMRCASRWAALPPRINFAIRNPITRLLSNPSIIQFHMLRYS